MIAELIKRNKNTAMMLTLLGMLMPQDGMAQQSRSFSSRIKTLQVQLNGEWGEPPVMLLNSGQAMHISFDDLQGDYERYTYTITHCNADWTQSDLHVSEYMTGFNDQRIDDYTASMGTEQSYNHYTFTLPNEDTQLLVSGNYRVDIFEDGKEEPIAQACFSIIEPKVGVDIEVSGNTDIDNFTSHQQLSFSINYSGYPVSNPTSDLKPMVLQNRRWDNHVEGLQPTYMQLNKLIYDHQRKLIFPAGNEYRRFEMLDEYVPTLRVERMEYDAPYYHATVFTDEQRINYMYDEDQNGRLLVRNGDDVDDDTESDYFITHFTLKMPQVAGGDLYLFGDLTDNVIDEDYKMEYNLLKHQYELALPLKQGSYNYLYMFVRDGENVAQTAQAEGDFHQTENEYWVYVYHRPFGLRYDKLVGFKTYSTKQ